MKLNKYIKLTLGLILISLPTITFAWGLSNNDSTDLSGGWGSGDSYDFKDFKETEKIKLDLVNQIIANEKKTAVPKSLEANAYFRSLDAYRQTAKEKTKSTRNKDAGLKDDKRGDDGQGKSQGKLPTDEMQRKLTECGNWYIQNIAVYDQGSYKKCPLYKNVRFRKDCTGFTRLFMCYVSGKDIADMASSTMRANGDVYRSITNAGWKRYTASAIGGAKGLKAGDVMVKAGHAEVYYGNYEGKEATFGWGSVKTKVPSKTGASTNIGDPVRAIKAPDGYTYDVFYRYVG